MESTEEIVKNTYSTKEIGKRLNVSGSRVRLLLHKLVKDTHYYKIKRVVLITEAGMKRLMELQRKGLKFRPKKYALDKN